MLTRFIEATQVEVELPDDDPTAVTIVCTIGHLRFDDLPLSLTLRELHESATFCDKYDTTALVRLWLKPWIEE